VKSACRPLGEQWQPRLSARVELVPIAPGTTIALKMSLDAYTGSLSQSICNGLTLRVEMMGTYEWKPR